MLKLVSRRAARPADIQAHCGGRQLSRKIGSISDEVHFTLTRHENWNRRDGVGIGSILRDSLIASPIPGFSAA